MLLRGQLLIIEVPLGSISGCQLRVDPWNDGNVIRNVNERSL